MDGLSLRRQARTVLLRPILAVVLLCSFSAVLAQSEPSARTDNALAMEECYVKQESSLNSKVRVSLERSGTTGYEWFIQLPKKTSVRILSHGAARLDSKANHVGAAIGQWWILDVGKAKSAQLDFFLYRPWEGKESAIKHCVVDVTVVSSHK